MASLPSDSLKDRSFISLIIAQFLASFNDQAIHAAAMFYAIHQGVLTERSAITILPILFFLPWAIFCTTSAYFADRFSKTASIRFWKFAEIPIALLLMFGFWLGDRSQGEFGITVGTWCVLAGVFLMGTHAAFFSPAKYGAMPEILQAHVLSRGNGILESSTFLANIFGTAAGGVLSFLFYEREIWIGQILLGIAVLGAGVSMFMAWLPPSDPNKKFNLWTPLIHGGRDVFASRPLKLGVLGIAFFVFMATYMRSVMYMHGQTRVPPWGEDHTSLIVATVALGVGIGSPLAGWLSGGKIELGLVPIGCVGMILGAVFASVMLWHDIALIVSLILLGFFSGFYMVPLYAIVQHRAPKKSKGEIIAFSNLVNVLGAMAAPALFNGLTGLCDLSGLTPVIQQDPKHLVGKVAAIEEGKYHHLESISIDTDHGVETLLNNEKSVLRRPKVIAKGMEVAVSAAHLRAVDYFWVRPVDQPNRIRYNYESLTRYLFLAASIMALIVLVALLRLLPDFPVRSVFGWVTLGKYQLKAIRMSNLPQSGPVVLATNSDALETCLQVVSATDRDTLVVMVEPPGRPPVSSFLRRLALAHDLVAVRPPLPQTDIVAGSPAAVSGQPMASVKSPDLWAEARKRAVTELAEGNLVAVTVNGDSEKAHVDTFLNDLRNGQPIPVVPVWCGALPTGNGKQVRVVFGEPVICPSGVDIAQVKLKIDALGEWIRENDGRHDLH
jgi:MFS family permease